MAWVEPDEVERDEVERDEVEREGANTGVGCWEDQGRR